MKNPFLFGQTVTGEAFVDREREIEEITAHLKRGQNVILYSPRRYGKTSLMLKTREALEAQGVLVFYLDMYRITSLEEFVSAFSRIVISRIRSPARKLLAIVQSLLPSLRPRLIYQDPSTPTIELEIGPLALSKKETLKELFNAAEHYATSKKKRACVILDEFQEITLIEPNDKLEREMRSAFQHHRRVSYVFLGSRHHLMEGIFRDRNRPFYNFGLHYPLGAIGKKDWVAHIERQFEKGGMALPENLANDVVAITRGHPYYTQLICSELWEARRERNSVEKGILSDIQERVLGRENQAFSTLWDGFNMRQRKLLEAVAREERASLMSKDFLKRYGFGAPSSIQRAAEALTKRDIISRDGDGSYLVTDPVFALWLRQASYPVL